MPNTSLAGLIAKLKLGSATTVIFPKQLRFFETFHNTQISKFHLTRFILSLNKSKCFWILNYRFILVLQKGIKLHIFDTFTTDNYKSRIFWFNKKYVNVYSFYTVTYTLIWVFRWLIIEAGILVATPLTYDDDEDGFNPHSVLYRMQLENLDFAFTCKIFDKGTTFKFSEHRNGETKTVSLRL